MRMRCLLSGLLALTLVLAGCAGVKSNLKGNEQVKRVAVVSLAISDWGRSVDTGSAGGTSVGTLMESATGKLLTSTEKTLSEHWQVKRASTFASDPAYRKLAEDVQVSTYSPSFGNREMPLFGPGFKKGDITPEKARALCKVLKVDAVVLVFSEWTAVTGGVVPTTRARSKNVVAFWDKNGKKIFHRRVDMSGRRVIGAGGVKAVTHETIKDWIESYDLSLNKMFVSL